MPVQTINWKGRKLEVEFEVMPPDREVGIISEYPEMLSIKDDKGNELPPLSVKEEDEILDLIVMPEEA